MSRMPQRELPPPATRDDERHARPAPAQQEPSAAWTTLALGSDPGTQLDAGTRAELQPGFAQPLPDVRIHQGPTADAAARGADALAFSVGRDIVFRNGSYDPHTPDGRALVGHELAHSIQGVGGAAAGRETSYGTEPAELEAARAAAAIGLGGKVRLSALPAARVQRQRMSSATATERAHLALPSARPIDVPQATIDSYFQTLSNGSYGSSMPAPAGVTVRLAGIPAQHLTPMTSIAMELASRSYSSPATGSTLDLFGPGTTMTVHLNLAPHGLADGDYRFSWTGSASHGTIFIETLTGAPAALNTPVAPAPPAATQPAGGSGTGARQSAGAAQAAAPAMPSGTAITVGTLNFTLFTAWPQDRFAHLTRALALVPSSALRVVDGLAFAIGSGRGPAGEDGHYDDTQHRVTMFDSAWSTPDIARFGDSPWAVYAIAHEIGHAVDLAPLRAAWQRYSGGSYATAAQEHAAGQTLTAARSQSGTRYTSQAGVYTPEDPLAGRAGAFRTAAAADGVHVPTHATTLAGGPTEYAGSNWEDMYAESFALYNTDPELLRLIRPHIYAYFASRFPR